MQENSLCSIPFPVFIVCRFFDDGYSDGMRWYIIVVLTYIFLIMCDVEHLFMGLLAIYYCTKDRDQDHPQEKEMQKSKMAV